MGAFFRINPETQELEQADRVGGVGVDLSIDSMTEYKLPIDGWYFFNSMDEAKIFFKLEQ